VWNHRWNFAELDDSLAPFPFHNFSLVLRFFRVVSADTSHPQIFNIACSLHQPRPRSPGPLGSIRLAGQNTSRADYSTCRTALLVFTEPFAFGNLCASGVLRKTVGGEAF